MGIIGYIIIGILGVIAIIIAIYILALLRTIIGIAAIVASIYLIFFADNFIGGMIVLGSWYAVDYVIKSFVSKYHEDTPQKETIPKKTKEKNKDFFSSGKPTRRKNRRQTNNSGINWNFILMCVIPIFWPVLIFKTFFGSKYDDKYEKEVYDYEQHLKSNRK